MEHCCETITAKVGEPAPAFTVPAFVDKEIKNISLKDYKGKWVILFFYPADFTFVCPTELEDLADHYEEFKKLNTEILSISVDTVWAHKVWKDISPKIKKVQFPMLSDNRRTVSEAYGVLDVKEGVAIRGRFIIDPDGVLVGMEVLNNNVGRSAAELLRQLKAFQHVREHGDACPASWTEGQDTLKPGLDIAGKL